MLAFVDAGFAAGALALEELALSLVALAPASAASEAASAVPELDSLPLEDDVSDGVEGVSGGFPPPPQALTAAENGKKAVPARTRRDRERRRVEWAMKVTLKRKPWGHGKCKFRAVR